MTAGLAEGAEAACAAGRCREAIEALEEEIRHRPASVSAYYTLGLCYSGGCRAHEWTHAGIAAQYLGQALKLLGERGGMARASILDALGSALAAGREPSALRAAIERHLEAAAIYQGQGREDDWARLQFNIGNSLCALSEITGEDHWQEAVARYENALAIRTREKDELRHAAVLENLGSAYRFAGNIRKAIDCYHCALRICRRAVQPARRAAIENNLGNAFLSLPSTDRRADARNARRALHHLDRALRLRRQEQGSREYGITQYNRAQAFLRLDGYGLDAVVTCLEAAAAAFRACGEGRYLEWIDRQLVGQVTKRPR